MPENVKTGTIGEFLLDVASGHDPQGKCFVSCEAGCTEGEGVTDCALALLVPVKRFKPGRPISISERISTGEVFPKTHPAYAVSLS